MAVIPLEYQKHWMFRQVYKKSYVEIQFALKPEIVKWLCRHGVSHTVIRGRDNAICILNSQQAMLFKLTWL